ncbi:unnamed protein product, partial [Mesorhabditis belari]|uniref:Uncharacterized protein n=1 Tax=Mesorhabditis belari TaxID=2138241 RepID=A0AAF3JA97_9BILA
MSTQRASIGAPKSYLQWLLKLVCCFQKEKDSPRPIWPLSGPLLPPPPPPPKWRNRRASVATTSSQKNRSTRSPHGSERMRRHSTAAPSRKASREQRENSRKTSRSSTSTNAGMNPNIEAALSSWKTAQK